MKVYFAALALIATGASVARLIVAISDYRRKWVRLPSQKVFNIPGRNGR